MNSMPDVVYFGLTTGVTLSYDEYYFSILFCIRDCDVHIIDIITVAFVPGQNHDGKAFVIEHSEMLIW